MKLRVGFGFGTTAGAGLSAEVFWEAVDAAEALRFDSAWFSERAASDLPEPLATMAAVAARTEHLKVGTSVLVVPGRNPVLLAKELATIDFLSNGRLLPAFGLGADLPKEREVFGIARGELPARTEEAVVLMKRLWTEREVTHEGRFFTVRALRLGPKPAQSPHPDVWFGGHSKAALSRVGRLGEGWLPSFVIPGEYQGMAEEIRRVAAEHERAIDEEHYGALVPYLPDGTEQEDAVYAAVAARRPGADPREIVAPDGRAGLRRKLEDFATRGASKFVVVPVLPPKSWPEELDALRTNVVAPLQGG
jgi:probable F420-dependent oxidoreductase